MKRCEWVTNDPDYIAYHDLEWGVPVHDDGKLFEMLILEGAQAGLSWITILKRRESFRAAYNNFDPVKIAEWDNKKIDELVKNKKIIRNKMKIESARSNARAYLEILQEYNSFDDFIWSFVKGNILHNTWTDGSQLPTSSPESEQMSKALKKRGLKFVGPTICYAYMQAVGMVNDHLTDCFRYQELRRETGQNHSLASRNLSHAEQE